MVIADEFEAVVFDLDGTLIDLPVDWSVATSSILALLDKHNVTPPQDFWDTFEPEKSGAYQAEAHELLAHYECDAARASDRLSAADLAAGLSATPVGVCSLNSEEACRIALNTHDLASDMDCIVGRDSTGSHKPDPEPLLRAADALSATPDSTLFIGDSEVDKRTAERAGTEFANVSEVRQLLV